MTRTHAMKTPVGKPREVVSRCKDCGVSRMVKLYRSYSSPVSRCPACIDAMKDRAFHAAQADRVNGGKGRVKGIW